MAIIVTGLDVHQLHSRGFIGDQEIHHESRRGHQQDAVERNPVELFIRRGFFEEKDIGYHAIGIRVHAFQVAMQLHASEHTGQLIQLREVLPVFLGFSILRC